MGRKFFFFSISPLDPDPDPDLICRNFFFFQKFFFFPKSEISKLFRKFQIFFSFSVVNQLIFYMRSVFLGLQYYIKGMNLHQQVIFDVTSLLEFCNALHQLSLVLYVNCNSCLFFAMVTLPHLHIET